MIDLSIVVVSYRVKSLLLDCIASIYSDADQPTLEIIVVDNASGDGTPSAVRAQFPQVRLIENQTNAGFPAANNQALPHCSGQVVLLLNPDTLVHKGTLKALCAFLGTTSGPAVVGLDLRNLDGSPQICAHQLPTMPEFLWSQAGIGPKSKTRTAIPHNKSSGDQPTRVGWVSGAALALNRPGVELLEGLDVDLFWAEDLDLGFRAAKKNIPVYFLRGVSVTHLSGQSGKRNMARMLYHQHASRIILLQKHFGQWPALLLSGWFTLILIAKIAARTLQGLSLVRRTESRERVRGYVSALNYMVFRREPRWSSTLEEDQGP